MAPSTRPSNKLKRKASRQIAAETSSELSKPEAGDTNWDEPQERKMTTRRNSVQPRVKRLPVRSYPLKTPARTKKSFSPLPPAPGKRIENREQQTRTAAEEAEDEFNSYVNIKNDEIEGEEEDFEQDGAEAVPVAARVSVSNKNKIAGGRPFSCQFPKCVKGFARRSDLVRHSRIHTNERPFVCPYPACGKSFIQRSALTVHMRVHTGERPHSCEVCQRAFADSSSLARHRRVHTGQRPYVCPVQICGKDFCRKMTLTRHVAKIHPEMNITADQISGTFGNESFGTRSHFNSIGSGSGSISPKDLHSRQTSLEYDLPELPQHTSWKSPAAYPLPVHMQRVQTLPSAAHFYGQPAGNYYEAEDSFSSPYPQQQHVTGTRSDPQSGRSPSPLQQTPSHPNYLRNPMPNFTAPPGMMRSQSYSGESHSLQYAADDSGYASAGMHSALPAYNYSSASQQFSHQGQFFSAPVPSGSFGYTRHHQQSQQQQHAGMTSLPSESPLQQHGNFIAQQQTHPTNLTIPKGATQQQERSPNYSYNSPTRPNSSHLHREEGGNYSTTSPAVGGYQSPFSSTAEETLVAARENSTEPAEKGSSERETKANVPKSAFVNIQTLPSELMQGYDSRRSSIIDLKTEWSEEDQRIQV